jgi:redox-sensing transcriptional repressor
MKKFSKNQLQRYPIYLKFLREKEAEGMTTISSPKIAKELGYSEEQIRKDLQAVCNAPGRPKKGRDIRYLIDTLDTFLGYKGALKAAIVGVGHLGGALLNYPGFESMGFRIVAAFDTDPEKIGKEVHGVTIQPLSELTSSLKNEGIRTVILTMPASSAQAVADEAINAGAIAFWNFAPAHLSVPEGVIIENVNLASSLAVLSHRLTERLEEDK